MRHRGHVFTTLCLAYLTAWCLSGCSRDSGVDGDPGDRQYAGNVEVSLRLGPSSGVIDFTKEDFFFTVTNNGQKAVTELSVEIVFFGREGFELGRTKWQLVIADKRMERIADTDNKAKHRPLLPGRTIKLSTDVLYLFAGESGLRDQVVNHWDNLTTDVSILKVLTRDAQDL